MTALTKVEKAIGDLNHPWYRDERARDQALQAQAVAYWGMSTLVNALGAAMAWFGSGQVAGWAAGLGLVTYGTAWYVTVRIRQSVDPAFRLIKNISGIGVAWAASFILLTLGLMNRVAALASPDTARGIRVGFVVGAVTALITLRWYAKKQRRAASQAADLPDEE